MTTTPRPKPRTRRFLQFSLRTLLIFVLLVSIGMSWFAVKLERARRQREAVEVIRTGGGGSRMTPKDLASLIHQSRNGHMSFWDLTSSSM
jgi:hypothetical protein